jgi:hypothetical protein
LNSLKHGVEQDEPEIENAKILQRHAEEQGISPNQMFFKDEYTVDKDEDDENRLDDEIIVTAEDCIDDFEEEAAQRINKKSSQNYRP